ncbi:hypothetical protein KGY64_03060 [Candidatus Bipolaricaulota bacterium]|nr:hypothetical protein [Candidatus Bipolaricaulota bacterium]
MLEAVLIVAFGGALLTYLVGRWSAKGRDYFALALWVVILGMTSYLHPGKPRVSTFYPGFLGNDLQLRVTSLSWLFAIIVASISVLVIIYSFRYIKGHEKSNLYYLLLLLVNGGMLGVTLSGDFLSFYVFWEIASWSTFLLISFNQGRALAAGLRYVVMSVIGSGAMLFGMLSLYSSFGTLDLADLSEHLAGAGGEYVLFIFLLFLVSFGIKNAIIPFHTWLPPAHSEAPAPFSAVLSGVLIKMGTYGMLLIFYLVAGAKIFLGLGTGIWSFHSILSGLAAVTIVLPSFVAILQNDAKRMLAWSTVGQAGYIVLGISFGTRLAVAGGIFHFLNHALFKSLLFMSIGAVERKTSTRDLNDLGGLVKRTPVLFIATLVGVAGLIGVPLTNGFFSKWMIYKTLILDGNPLLAFAALIGTWGTILYSYKLIHNVFFGQLPEKYRKVTRSSFSTYAPMVILAVAIIFFGIFPGFVLGEVSHVTTTLGFPPLDVELWGLSSDTGMVNTLNLLAAFVIVAAVVWFVFKSGAESPKVAQDDSYTAGAPVPEGKFTYTADFYGPLERVISPYLKDRIDIFYGGLIDFTEFLSDTVRRMYTGYVGTYVAYILALLAVVLLVQLGWSPW